MIERLKAWWGRVPQLGVLAVLAVVVLAERYSRAYQRNQVDDAMTSIQYAKQLALGNGLVFNVGERVEGYTNFLWVVFMAPIYAACRALGFEFVPVIVFVNILLAGGVTLLVYLLGARLWGPTRLATFVALGLCVADNSFTVWAALGLEVHFLALWMLLALYFARTRKRKRALATGLALLAVHLTRPDAGLFCAVVVGNELFEAALAARRRERAAARGRLFDALVMGAVWVLPYAAYFAWRYAYYGALFPNTYYLKLDGEIDAWTRGVEYLRSFLDERAWVPLAALFAVFSLGDATIRALFVYLALHVTYVTYVGGDFFPGHRFYVPEIPQFALLAGSGVASLAGLLGREAVSKRLGPLAARPGLARAAGFAAAVAVLTIVYSRGLALGPYRGEVLAWGNDLSAHRRLLRWVGERKPEGATFATCLIGHTGYYSDARVIDICGVLDPVVARRRVRNFGKGRAGHEKIARPDEILAKKPTYVALNVLHVDLWRRGYFFDPNVPERSFEGLWTRDTLAERGHYLDETRVSFDRREPGWRARGSAFASFPAYRFYRGQGSLVGASGGFVNSYHPKLGNRATGVLRSPPLHLEGELLVFRVAGGRDPERLTVRLLIDEKPVYTTTGRNGDMMSRRTWDLRPYPGRSAVLEVADRATGDWGYIALDEVGQWTPHGG